jgi:DNA-binding NtrC family response regulator
LLESELFGHVRGAFTGAVSDHPGLFEQASGGTLLLDEIGDMSPAMQAKLLRVLQDGELVRVGGSEVLKVDVRLISATNRDLETLITEGRFREDLHYRVNTVTLRTPALRERRGDVPALAAHFAQAACRRHHWRPRGFAPEALALLGEQPWRGNVRELKNVVERALILCEGDPIGAAELRALLDPARPRPGAIPTEGRLADLVEGYERDVIRERLRALSGHATNAAKSLGLERSHLYKKCKHLGLEMREEG